MRNKWHAERRYLQCVKLPKNFYLEYTKKVLALAAHILEYTKKQNKTKHPLNCTKNKIRIDSLWKSVKRCWNSEVTTGFFFKSYHFSSLGLMKKSIMLSICSDVGILKIKEYKSAHKMSWMDGWIDIHGLLVS